MENSRSSGRQQAGQQLAGWIQSFVTKIDNSKKDKG
jgi:hypothetical protein